MARRLIVIFLAALLFGCSSLTTVFVVNETSRPMRIEAEFLSQDRHAKLFPKMNASLAPGKSVAVLDKVFSPRGELVVVVDGKRTERFPIQGTSGGGDIWCRIKGATAATHKGTAPIDTMIRIFLLGGLGALGAIIVGSILFANRRQEKLQQLGPL